MNTKFVPAPLDEAQPLEETVTRTATANGTTQDLGEAFAPGGPGQAFSAVVDAAELNAAATYAVKLQQSDNGSTWTDLTVAVPVTAAGVTAIPAFVSKRYIRLHTALGGTSPSITYRARLVAHPVHH